MVHATLILRDGRIEATRHEGFKSKCVSLTTEREPIDFFWFTGERNEYTSKGAIRIAVELPEERVAEWQSTCGERELVKQSMKRADVSGWRVAFGDIEASNIASVEMKQGSEFVHVSLPVLETLLAGRAVRIYHSQDRTAREVVF